MNLQAGKNSVHFISKTMGGDLRMAGDLYVPENFDASKQYPSVVLTGAFNQVKEQTCAVYARKLAAKGYVALAFDHQGYGDSEGAIRSYEYFPAKVEGIQDAVSYLRTLSFVDADKLYGLGVCAGAAHMAYAALTDKRIKKVAFVGGMLATTVVHWMANGKKMDKLLADANTARQHYYATGEVKPIDTLDMENGVAQNSKVRDQREGYDYYMTERAGAQTYPNYTHKSPAFFLEADARYSARAIARYMTTPTLTIYGTKASTKVFSWLFHFAKKRPKKLVRIKGATHVDLYDRDEYVDQAIDKMLAFFQA